MSTKRLLDANEIHNRVPGWSLRTIRTWLAENRLPTTRLGRRVFVEEGAFDRWLEDRSRPARADLGK